MAMRGEVCGGSGGEFGGGSGGIGSGAVARVRVRAVASAMKVAVVPVGRERTGAVVVVLGVAVVVAVVVEVEVAVAGGVPFGPPNEIKIKSTLDNMLVHLIFISLMIIITYLHSREATA